MKTNLLFAASLFLSTASFAQEATTKNDQTTTAVAIISNPEKPSYANVSTSSNSSVKISAADKIAQKADQTKQGVKKEAAGQKEALESQKLPDAGISTDAGISAETKSNKLSQETSLNSQANVSAESAKSNGKELKEKGQASLNSGTASAIETNNKIEKQTKSGLIQTNSDVKKDAKLVKSTSVKAVKNISKTVKPIPASLKMHTELKGNAGLKIK
jgi:hypothetical protein